MDVEKKEIAVFISVLLILVSVTWFVLSDSDVDFREDKVILIDSYGEEIEISVEIAETSKEKQQGLMGRESLCDNCGMLFVFEEDVEHGFWMKDTYIPLSIAFISENGTIIEIQHMEPETTDTHKPDEPYRYALEMNQGSFEDNDIVVGDTVVIPEKYI